MHSTRSIRHILLLSIIIIYTASVSGFTTSSSSLYYHSKPNIHLTICRSSLLSSIDKTISSGAIDNDPVKKELHHQDPNEDAPTFDIYNSDEFYPMTELDVEYLEDHRHLITHPHFETRSLNDLFPNNAYGLSEKFNTCASFRNRLRGAIRLDMIFGANSDDTEQPSMYNEMTDEQRYEEVEKNKILLGYWKIPTISTRTGNNIQMKHTTNILQEYFGHQAPTGDEFIEKIGSLCNSTQTPYHITDVSGVSAFQNKQQGEKTDHAWHQDYGSLQDKQSMKGTKSYNDENDFLYQSNNHVFFAFPATDNYKGTGVFPHLVKLRYEQWAKPKGAKAPIPGKSFFYKGRLPGKYIVRPKYEPGKELLIFRDIDVLHSSPDIQYRASVMRFG